MRIIAGAARGRRLAVPPGRDVRPTADRVREALFSSLHDRVRDAHVLDLYAGAGGLGLEAASRGAASVTLIERDHRVAQTLRRNVATVGAEAAEVIVGDAASFLASGHPPHAYDLVFVDPPYRTGADELIALLSLLCDRLAEGARVVVERPTRASDLDWPDRLHPESSRRYGDTTLHRASYSSRAPDPDTGPATTERAG